MAMDKQQRVSALHGFYWYLFPILPFCGTYYDWEVDDKAGQLYLAGTHPAYSRYAAILI
jgi:hypothetical protein